MTLFLSPNRYCVGFIRPIVLDSAFSENRCGKEAEWTSVHFKSSACCCSGAADGHEVQAERLTLHSASTMVSGTLGWLGENTGVAG